MLDSGRTPAENLAVYNFFSGNFAYGAKDYPKAIKRLEAARAAGSTEPNVPILLMDSYLNAGQVEQGLATAKAALEANPAAGHRPSHELYVRPIKALLPATRTNHGLHLMALPLADQNQPDGQPHTPFIALTDHK